jgi:hypothetical protein
LHSITEFTRTDESIIVSRVLMTVHAELDRSYPNLAPAPKQFRKTVFSENDPTALNPSDEDDSPTLINRAIPPPPKHPDPAKTQADFLPPPPRSDVNLLDQKGEGPKKVSKNSKIPRTLTQANSQFPEFSRIEKNPYLLERRRRKIISLSILISVLIGLAYLLMQKA